MRSRLDVVGAPHALSDAPITGQAYGLLFPDLPPLDMDNAFIRRLGSFGGLCDGSDAIDDARDDAREAAGWPFFGQYLAHDVTADRSALVAHTDVVALRNARRQKVNLESLYGASPAGDPFLYDVSDPAKLLLGHADVQRNAQGIAIIGDPRNDSHLMMSQMHFLFCTLHNAVVDWVRGQHTPAADVFQVARELTRYHYQWVVLHDFLPRLIGEPLAAELETDGARYYDPCDEPFIPMEFAAGAYRYGHGQIRHRYKVNAAASPVPMFPDLIGFRPVEPAHVIDWAYLFDLPGRAPAQRAKKLDGRLTRSLMHLPEAISGAVATGAHRALSVRDLQRGQAVGLASGETIARHIGVEPLTREETGLAAIDWQAETPLWYYVLKESAVRANGDQLGPVGSRIVGDVLVGLLDYDPESFRSTNRDWRPVLPSATPGDFTLADLVAFALPANRTESR